MNAGTTDWSAAHDAVTSELRRMAERFVRGELAPDALRSYEQHVASCGVCESLCVDEASTISGIARIAPRAAVATDAWTKIAAELALSGSQSGGEAPGDASVQPWKQWIACDRPGRDVAGLAFVSGSDGPWEPSGTAGIHTRRLAVDPVGRRVTMLVRMDPGSSYPPHRHGGAEECYVVSGDLRVGTDLRMQGGDFQRAEAGTVHPVQSTEHGCVLLIVSSIDDELLL